MAGIFLSYARADAPKAERITELLEAAGHTVWWDRQIRAGSRFSAEIDRALRDAEVIVVLWSRRSVESAWVQDEAAIGRDSGRLYPVLLENVLPPLGFRQYQAVDFCGWSGRGRPRNLELLIDAIGTRSTAVPPAKLKRPTISRNSIIGGSAGVMVVGCATTALLLSRTASAPTLLLAAGGTGDPSASRIFARQVTQDLARFHPASLEQLSVVDDAQANVRPTYRAEVTLNNGKDPSADLSLITRGRPGVSWSESVDGNVSPQDLRQHAASSLATALGCAMKADGSTSKLSTANYRLFLTGCSAAESEYSDLPPADTIATLRQLGQSAPKFAPTFALLALADLNLMSPGEPDTSLIEDAKRALARAKQLDSSLEEVSVVEALLYFTGKNRWSQGFPVLARGLKLHPKSAILLDLEAKYLMSVGRMSEAADLARQAQGFEPLSGLSTARMIEALAYSNRIPAAFELLAKAKAAWPDSAVLENTRYSLNLRYGDPGTALSQLRKAGANEVGQAAFDDSWTKFLLARTSSSPASVEAALQSFRDRYKRNPADISGYLQALGTFGRTAEAFQVTSNRATLVALQRATEILFRPHMRSVLFDPRFIGVAYRLGLLAFWRTSGDWPDFCSDPSLPYDCKKVAAQYRT